MNSIVLTDDSGIISDSKILNHLHTTLKAKLGDQFKFTILNKGMALGTITELSLQQCIVEFKELTSSPPAWFQLIVGVSRPQTTKKILEHATTFGVQKIHFFKAELSEKSYLTSKVFEEKNLLECLIDGLSQSALYTHLPKVEVSPYNPASTYKDHAQKYILDIADSHSFISLKDSLDFTHPITLAIGPERGFTKKDLETFHQAGFKSVKISSSILRVEHAIYSAVSQLELLRQKY
jgi:16S rRNA (uracil1498-N3)-methyltransferase